MFKGTLTKFSGHREYIENAIRFFYTNREYNNYFELQNLKGMRNVAVTSIIMKERKYRGQIKGTMIFSEAPFNKVNTRKTAFGDILFNLTTFYYIRFSADLTENGELKDIYLLEKRLATDDEVCESFCKRYLARKKLY